MHDKDDAIIYVGKAISLRNRVRSYFRESTNKSPKIEKMVTKIARFEYIVTDSELEALVLENNLIKEHNPKYNTMLKDDKTYPYIKVTMGEDFPRVLFSRQMKKDKSRYFGPFTSAFAVKDTIELINKLYKLRTCNRVLPRDIGLERPCLNYHIGQCMAPCQEYVTKEEYRAQVEQALDFLNGNFAPILNSLKQKMEEASENLEFEDAIRYRDLYNSVKQVAQKQKITSSGMEDRDIIAMAKENEDAVVQVFFVRGGKLIGREHFIMTRTEDCTQAQVLLDFVKQFYAGTPFIPKELMLQHEIEDIPVLEQWLSARKGSKVHIHVPKKGTKEKLVELAATNAKLVLSKDRERIKREEGRTIGAVKEICELLSIPEANRMEAFDISNISGVDKVGSMVVFIDGEPERSSYRRFRIRTVEGADDFASLREVLARRLAKLGTEEEERFAKPDLVVIDGGKGQLSAVKEVFQGAGVSDIELISLAKREEEIFTLHAKESVLLDKRDYCLRMLQRLRDEAHRFAITYFRNIHSKRTLTSVLTEIPGVGKIKRRALLEKFGSIDRMMRADIKELAAVDGIGENLANVIKKYFEEEL